MRFVGDFIPSVGRRMFRLLRLVEGREEQVEVHLGGGFITFFFFLTEEGGSPGWRIPAGRRT